MASPDDKAHDWKNRRMKGGDWVDPAGEIPVQRADKVVTVRLTEAELAEFDAQITVLGIKRNRALRIAARRIGGFVEADAAQIEELRSINRQLTGIARNINQIAKSANRTHEPAYRAFMEDRADLGRVLARVFGELQVMLDLSARREDGLERLDKAAAK